MSPRRLHVVFVILILSLFTATALTLHHEVERRQHKEVHFVAPQNNLPAPSDSIRYGIRQTATTGAPSKTSSSTDLKDPDNITHGLFYDEKTSTYYYGTQLGGKWITTPFMLSKKEAEKLEGEKKMREFYKKKNAELVEARGKDEFDFSNMHFNLGPAEKIFGPGGVRIKTQGAIELKLGANMRNVDNPSLSERNRKVFGFDFDEKVNLNVNGKIGDKMGMDFNYNSNATFSFDAQKLKLRYEGKEDEIIKLIEAGDVSMPTTNSLIKGAGSLFGVHSDLQFGKLKLSLLLAQKKSSSQSVESHGGTQLQNFAFSAADYDANRHFFLAHFFRDTYDNNMSQLPNILSGVTIKRIEIWVTNTTGQTDNTRNIVALTDLGESKFLNTSLWHSNGDFPPQNAANNVYATLTGSLVAARNISSTTQVLDGFGLKGGHDYEKLESARLLSSNEYEVNNALGYISLQSTLQTDQVLAVAYEYTYRGKSYQVGEFSTDITNPNEALFVKSLKNTSCTPEQGNWDLMMKNIYSLGASDLQKEKFRLDIKYLSDTTGVKISYLPIPSLKEKPLLQLLGLDRLDNNNRRHPNGYYDFVEHYTVDAKNGRVIFTSVEPFGSYLRAAIGNNDIADKFVYQALYDSTRTVAKQMAEQNKYYISGQYKASREDEIYLGAMNVPRGSVVVTAGGITLTEGSDYTVDYYGGTVTILNKSLLDAGTPIKVSLENDTEFGMQRKTVFGMNWQYDFSKQFTLGGTFMHLGEKPLTTKVAFGSEAINNTLWGLNFSYKKESQWLTDVLDKLPLLHLTEPSSFNLKAEFAQLHAGKVHGTQGNASYLDDFENADGRTDISNPKEWSISSTPSMFPESQYMNDVRYGYNRALLAWYYIDPLFTRRSSSLTPGHIKNDLDQLSDPDVREVFKSELFPNKSINTQESLSMNVLNLAFYPNERGPYNLTTELNPDGTLQRPKARWGGMMRALTATDFEAANVEYLEFWMQDPFIKAKEKGETFSGNLYFNLGEISEDILKDGKKSFESGLPIDNDPTQYTETLWGRVPNRMSVTYAFNTSDGAREKQDVGFNGLSSEDEANFPLYKAYLQQVKAILHPDVYEQFAKSPSGDKYHYFRGSDYDAEKRSILDRYKYINNPNGNSSDAKSSGERYSTAYKTTPDVEDLNGDYTLNEYERYYQYHIHISPEDMEVGKNYIVDSHTSIQKLRNNSKKSFTWYLFRIPVKQFEKNIGGINGFNSIRFMRMFMTDFEQPVVLRLANLALVRGDWRTYEQRLNQSQPEGNGTLEAGTVNFEENNDKTPVNYVIPPGISRELEPGNRELLENNEQSLSMVLKNLSSESARAVYKNTSLDLRRYKHLQMFTHANSLIGMPPVENGAVSVFIRLGSDYQSNYYEYEIPLTITPAGNYPSNNAGAKAVWPEENMLDMDLSLFTHLKTQRNKQKALGLASYNQVYSAYDKSKPANKISVMGNPSLGDIRTIMIGVRNNSAQVQYIEVWVNELRLQDMSNKGGWAAQASANLQISDLASVDLSGHIETEGFGGLEETVTQRRDNTLKEYSVTTNIQLGKLLPEKAQLSAPLYYSYGKHKLQPKYNPLDTDMPLKEAYKSMHKAEKDSLRHIAEKVVENRNLSLSGIRFNIISKKHPMPYDPANFTFSYAHSSQHTTGETTAWEKNQTWKWGFNYNYATNFRPAEPFKKLIKSRSKWFQILKKFGINYAPQNISFNSDIQRTYFEMQERDMENLDNHSIPLVWSSDFLWKRDFGMRWDLTKNLHLNFNSGTNAEIVQPYTAVNKDLYPERYQAWKDSVWMSIKHFGTPLDYSQSFDASWRLPIQDIPLFDWVSATPTYRSSYSWKRGAELDDGLNTGNMIDMGRDIAANVRLNTEMLYNHIPFLEKVNRKFARSSSYNRKSTPKEQRKFVKELQLLPDSFLVVNHHQNTKRPRIKAIRADGKVYRLKYKVVDKNNIRIQTHDSIKVKITVVAPPPAEQKVWYKTLQYLSRGAMMVRNISINYSNKFNMNVPGFLPNIGDFFGQSSAIEPGLDFAFGWTDEHYLEKAARRGWLLQSDSIITPASTTTTENWQIQALVEPLKDFKINLTATRNVSKNKNIQYMFEGMPTTETGAFTQTTLSIKTAFSKMGSAKSGYQNKNFDKFRNRLPIVQRQIQAKYIGSTYPQGTPLAGQTYNAANGTVNPYGAEVMIPAFLSVYSSGSDGLKIFPSLAKLLPNWTINYSGLSNLNAMKKVFKSFNLRHGYRSIYTVGGYNTYTAYLETVEGLGFVNDVATGLPIPSSKFDISTVSINESFAPLIGLDMTFKNDITAKTEVRKTRVLTLSMTNQQINETYSNDFVFGMGYRINDFKPFQRNKTVSPRRRYQRNRQRNNEKENNTKRTSTSGFANTLNVRFDITFRNQTGLNRDILSGLSQATGGNKAVKVSLAADYAISKLLTLTAYYDRQMNKPLLTSSSYPTVTQDFGISFRIRLNH